MTATSSAAAIVSLGVVALVAGPCRRAPVLTQLAEARRLAADIRVQVDRAADASNRAIMADTDEASRVFSRAAGRSRDAVTADADALAPILQDLGFAEEARARRAGDARLRRYPLGRPSRTPRPSSTSAAARRWTASASVPHNGSFRVRSRDPAGWA